MGTKGHITKQGFNSNEYETPKWLFNKLNNLYSFKCDMTCTTENEKIPGSFDFHKGDALNMPWECFKGDYVWLNPPYRPLRPWIEKAWTESQSGVNVVMIVPLATISAQYFQQYLPNEIMLFTKRINFEYKGVEIKGNAHCTCLLVYNASNEWSGYTQLGTDCVPDIHYID